MLQAAARLDYYAAINPKFSAMAAELRSSAGALMDLRS
jgi:hypothetical protein